MLNPSQILSFSNTCIQILIFGISNKVKPLNNRGFTGIIKDAILYVRHN